MTKKRTVFPLLLLAVLAATGCAKEHQCKCQVQGQDNDVLRVLTIDGSMRCEGITEMAEEEKYVTDDGEHSLRRTNVLKVSCRDYAE